jgi:hypothetical protein
MEGDDEGTTSGSDAGPHQPQVGIWCANLFLLVRYGLICRTNMADQFKWRVSKLAYNFFNGIRSSWMIVCSTMLNLNTTFIYFCIIIFNLFVIKDIFSIVTNMVCPGGSTRRFKNSYRLVKIKYLWITESISKTNMHAYACSILS